MEQRGQFAANGIGVTTPLIALKGVVVHEPSKRRAGDVNVYGVDDRFWKFHGIHSVTAPQNREVLLSEGLATELKTCPGDAVLLRLEKPSEIPVESLHGRKEDPGRTIRLNVSGPLAGESLGEFSLQPQHGAVRAVFVSLKFLQRELEQVDRVNTILVARFPETSSSTQEESIASLLKSKSTLADLGIELSDLDARRGLTLETESKIINDHIAKAAAETASASHVYE